MKSTTSSGFTLLELMIVLTIITILIGLAVPNFTNTINRNKVQDVIRGFESALKTAKHTARISGRLVHICPVDDLTLNTPVCSNWKKFSTNEQNDALGWVVFHDTNNNNQINQDEVIKKVPFRKSTVSVTWSNKNLITITPRGATFENGTLCVFIPNQNTLTNKCEGETLKEQYGAKVVLSKLGAIRTEKFYQ